MLVSNLKIGPVIGNGHFGRVHLSDDDVHGAVAVKVIEKTPLEADTEWLQRKEGLLREAQHLKKATHRNVVQVHHLVEADTSDAIYYVMEYCPDGSLHKAFEAGPLQLFVVRQVATEMAFGLQALHARGMLHRDIKPANVLMGIDGTAKLGDFGLVTDNIILGYGSQAGYSDHLAPEVWAGSGTSVRSDVWAFGMTLYRLLHGKAWYDESPKPRTLIQSGGFADKLKWLPHIPKRWKRLIRSMMRDDPNDRVKSAGGIITGLAKLPVLPHWACEIVGHEVRWTRKHKERRIWVVWERADRGKHQWKAWSEPLKSGNNMSLAGSNGKIPASLAEKQLQAFFERYES